MFDPVQVGESRVFSPVDGARLDLGSLDAMAEAPSSVLAVALARLAGPGAPGVALSGLALQGPPGGFGRVRAEPSSPEAVVSAGSALLRLASGRCVQVHAPQPLVCAWPGRTSPDAGTLLAVRVVQTHTPSAHDTLALEAGFVRSRPTGVLPPHILPLARADGQGGWLVDLAHVWQPEHPALERLDQQLAHLAFTIWRAGPEGSAWEHQVRGRNWLHYQIPAVQALATARLALTARPTTTADRVRILKRLVDGLRRTVERASLEVVQAVARAHGPYAALLEGTG